MKRPYTPLLLTLATISTLAYTHQAKAQEDGWVSLFDGETLEGWVQKNGTATYKVVDGTIVGTTAKGSPNSFLTTEKDYDNFELTFDVKLDDPLNSGVQIRSATKTGAKDNGRVYGPQVEIERSGEKGAESGYIFGEATGKKWLTAKEDLKPHSYFKDGEWNSFRIIANGPRIQTFINGQAIGDLQENTLFDTHPSGFIGLQVHGIGKNKGPFSVAWKNLKIKPLQATGETAPSTGGTPVTIFDGTTKGWTLTNESSKLWHAKEERKDRPAMLIRKATHGFAWYDKPVGDFELALEFNLSPNCNSGVFFRSDPENPVQGGFEIQLFDSAGEEPTNRNTGALYDAKAATSMEVKQPGEWNTFKLRAQGPNIVVHLNGVKIQDINIDDWTTANTNPDGTENKFDTPLKDLPRTGQIGLQDHGQDVSYRNITLLEL